MSQQTHQKVCKCSLTFPLKNVIVTFYENFTNKYGRDDKLGGVVTNLWYLGYLRYNILMEMAIRTIYTSKCVQIRKMSIVVSICNMCDMQKTVGVVDTTPPW